MEGSDGGKGVVDSEEGGQGMVALVEGRSECSPCRISNDDNDNVVIVPVSVCVASCHVAEWDTVPLAHCVVRGSGDMVCLSFPLVGAGRRLTVVGGVVVIFVIAGGRTRSSGAHLLVAIVYWSLSSLRVFIESLGRWRRFGKPALFVVM